MLYHTRSKRSGHWKEDGQVDDVVLAAHSFACSSYSGPVTIPFVGIGHNLCVSSLCDSSINIATFVGGFLSLLPFYWTSTSCQSSLSVPQNGVVYLHGDYVYLMDFCI